MNRSRSLSRRRRSRLRSVSWMRNPPSPRIRGRGRPRCQPSHRDGVTRVSHGDQLSRYASSVGESPVTSGDEIDDHQVIIRGGQVEAVVVPLEEYRALKALEQREAELYWAVHEARHPSRPGDDVPDGKVYDSMDALLADLGSDG
jgi:hypothetical protein